MMDSSRIRQWQRVSYQGIGRAIENVEERRMQFLICMVQRKKPQTEQWGILEVTV